MVSSHAVSRLLPSLCDGLVATETLLTGEWDPPSSQKEPEGEVVGEIPGRGSAGAESPDTYVTSRSRWRETRERVSWSNVSVGKAQEPGEAPRGDLNARARGENSRRALQEELRERNPEAKKCGREFPPQRVSRCAVCAGQT